MQQLRFHYKDTIYMHNSKSVFENEKQKILALKRIMHSRPEEEENVSNNGLCESSITQSKAERKWKADWIIARELKRLGNMILTAVKIFVGMLGRIPKSLPKELGEMENGGGDQAQ